MRSSLEEKRCVKSVGFMNSLKPRLTGWLAMAIQLLYNSGMSLILYMQPLIRDIKPLYGVLLCLSSQSGSSIKPEGIPSYSLTILASEAVMFDYESRSFNPESARRTLRLSYDLAYLFFSLSYGYTK